MKKIVMSIVTSMIVCCGEADAENLAGSYDNYIVPVVEINLDDLAFQEAFRIEYNAKGEGRTFWWRGNEYTTDLAKTLDEFVVYHASTEHETMGWVLNNDDPDDDCFYNCLIYLNKPTCDGTNLYEKIDDNEGDNEHTHPWQSKNKYKLEVYEDHSRNARMSIRSIAKRVLKK